MEKGSELVEPVKGPVVPCTILGTSSSVSAITFLRCGQEVSGKVLYESDSDVSLAEVSSVSFCTNSLLETVTGT